MATQEAMQPTHLHPASLIATPQRGGPAGALENFLGGPFGPPCAFKLRIFIILVTIIITTITEVACLPKEVHAHNV